MLEVTSRKLRKHGTRATHFGLYAQRIFQVALIVKPLSAASPRHKPKDRPHSARVTRPNAQSTMKSQWRAGTIHIFAKSWLMPAASPPLL